MDLKETDILGKKIDSHWYYQSKAKAMRCLLDKVQISEILDVGAGSGFFSKYLLRNSPAKKAWCVDVSYGSDFNEEAAGKPIHFRRSVNKVDADLVLLMDVLEHVDNDVRLLRDYVEKVPPDTYFLISVPAFKFLWSSHDIFLDHKRRYTLSEIEAVARQAGLRVNHGAYYFGTVFLIAAVLRLTERLLSKNSNMPQSQLKQHNPFINTTLFVLSLIELPIMKINRFVGLTAFCLAKKI